jgi:hypothetical protein
MRACPRRSARDANGFASETGPDKVDETRRDETRTKHQTLGVLISETHGHAGGHGDARRSARNPATAACPMRARSGGKARTLTVTHGPLTKTATCINAALGGCSLSLPNWGCGTPGQFKMSRAELGGVPVVVVGAQIEAGVPRCRAHPEVGMMVHPRRWGWICPVCRAGGQASPQRVPFVPLP